MGGSANPPPDVGREGKGPLFRTIARGTKRLSRTPLPQANGAPACRSGQDRDSDRQPFVPRNRDHCLSEKRRTLERAATMANHASTRTTQLYDRRSDDVALDEVERVLI